jgi:hypothetical protein
MKKFEANWSQAIFTFFNLGWKVNIVCIAMILFALCMPGKSYAFQLPWPGKCLVENDTTKTVNGLCMSTTYPTGMPVFNGKQTFLSMLDYQVEDNNTVPEEGDYFLDVILCPVSKAAQCGPNSGWVGFVVAQNTIHLLPNIPLSQQNTDFGPGATWTEMDDASQITMCLVIGKHNTNLFYSDSNLPYQCATATPLAPVVPSTCSLNSSQGLTVAFNEIDRSDISTTPASQTSGNVEKTIPVTCTGETAFTVKTKFNFTPITVSNNQVVASSNPNLGVAIIYNGKVVSPTDVFDETYQLGTNNINLEFQVVHDSSVATKDIATGDFSASAVMVMTQQ